MQKTKTILAVCCLLFAYTKAQTNLVPNPSFETYTVCPDTLDEISDATHWVNPAGGSPDYYNSCAPDTGCCNIFGVPQNSYGHQPARTGVAYAGIITEFEESNSLREYIQVKLTAPLLASTGYYVEFYVCYADSNCYAVNDIGAYFSSTSVSSTSDTVLPYSPQIFNNNISNPLTIKNVWIKVAGTFTASGGESYITIGNFKNNATTDTVKTNSGTVFEYSYSYYYIDDVLVTYNDSIAGINQYKTETEKIYPNPCKDFVHITPNTNIKRIMIENLQGEELLSIESKNLQNKIDVSFLNSGVYILKVISNDQQISSYKLIKL